MKIVWSKNLARIQPYIHTPLPPTPPLSYSYTAIPILPP
nr:MAG TPA: hypothetical protein [Bacteriophage sp.]